LKQVSIIPKASAESARAPAELALMIQLSASLSLAISSAFAVSKISSDALYPSTVL
jgi:hypothetical protein